MKRLTNIDLPNLKTGTSVVLFLHSNKIPGILYITCTRNYYVLHNNPDKSGGCPGDTLEDRSEEDWRSRFPDYKFSWWVGKNYIMESYNVGIEEEISYEIY